MSQNPKDLIHDEVTQRFQWFRDEEYNTELIKNRPRSVLISEIVQQHEDLRWLRQKFYELSLESD
jgi:hypothetical protein